MSGRNRQPAPVALAAPTEERLDVLEAVLRPEGAEGSRRIVGRTLDPGELLEISRQLPAGAVILLDADLARPEDESPVEFWRELTDSAGSPPLVLYAREPLLGPQLDLTFGRATGYVGSWRPDAAQKVGEAIRLAASGVRACFG